MLEIKKTCDRVFEWLVKFQLDSHITFIQKTDLRIRSTLSTCEVEEGEEKYVYEQAVFDMKTVYS
jgi:hypothetical protein